LLEALCRFESLTIDDFGYIELHYIRQVFTIKTIGRMAVQAGNATKQLSRNEYQQLLSSHTEYLAVLQRQVQSAVGGGHAVEDGQRIESVPRQLCPIGG
jgi:hypothetical protein